MRGTTSWSSLICVPPNKPRPAVDLSGSAPLLSSPALPCGAQKGKGWGQGKVELADRFISLILVSAPSTPVVPCQQRLSPQDSSSSSSSSSISSFTNVVLPSQAAPTADKSCAGASPLAPRPSPRPAPQRLSAGSGSFRTPRSPWLRPCPCCWDSSSIDAVPLFLFPSSPPFSFPLPLPHEARPRSGRPYSCGPAHLQIEAHDEPLQLSVAPLRPPLSRPSSSSLFLTLFLYSDGVCARPESWSSMMPSANCTASAPLHSPTFCGRPHPP
ncbi:hypothetical protein CDD83_1243 [Cordyceps sp. RAO-2017]|nr:hypothetical protein CDD83_1243 [Cordyceps sp. RAO-2017]